MVSRPARDVTVVDHRAAHNFHHGVTSLDHFSPRTPPPQCNQSTRLTIAIPLHPASCKVHFLSSEMPGVTPSSTWRCQSCKCRVGRIHLNVSRPLLKRTSCASAWVARLRRKQTLPASLLFRICMRCLEYVKAYPLLVYMELTLRRARSPRRSSSCLRRSGRSLGPSLVHANT